MANPWPVSQAKPARLSKDFCGFCASGCAGSLVDAPLGAMRLQMRLHHLQGRPPDCASSHNRQRPAAQAVPNCAWRGSHSPKRCALQRLPAARSSSQQHSRKAAAPGWYRPRADRNRQRGQSVDRMRSSEWLPSLNRIVRVAPGSPHAGPAIGSVPVTAGTIIVPSMKFSTGSSMYQPKNASAWMH